MDSYKLSEIAKNLLSMDYQSFRNLNDGRTKEGKDMDVATWMIAGMIDKAESGTATTFNSLIEILDKVAAGEYTEVTFGTRDDSDLITDVEEDE